MNNFKKSQPIIIGLAGKAGSGKTSVAEEIVPKGSFSTTKYGVNWDHIFFALPLYELASIRKSIKGFNENNRQLFAIHDVLFDIYGGSSLGIVPDYEDFISRVHKIHSLPIEPEGVKPRSFLQKAGDICRDGFEDCFAKWGIIKSSKLHQRFSKSLEEDSEELPFAVIISDVRFVNEAEAILKQPNGVIVFYDASQDTLNERLMKRDGKTMSQEQMLHKSEQEVNLVKDMATIKIVTDNMTIEDQANATVKSLGLLQEQHA